MLLIRLQCISVLSISCPFRRQEEQVLSRLKLPWRKALLILCVLAVGGVWGQSISAQEMQDVVYLKNGSVIRGTIVEQVPGESILIQTVDGNRFRYLMEEIERMAKEPNSQGVAQQQATGRSTKSPGTALLLSLVIPGGGQAYNGEWGKAAGFLVGTFALLGAGVEAADSDACTFDDDCAAAGGLLLAGLAVAVWSVVDAHKSAKAINERLTVAGLEFAPRPGIRVASTPRGNQLMLDVRLLRWRH